MEWVKALHIISVISWMAGLLYLPRLFVYHVDADNGSELSETFKIMERRLYRAIMTPAMIASWVFGLWMIFGFSAVSWDWTDGWGWVWMKGAFVIFLSGFHSSLGRYLKDFDNDKNTRSKRFFRIINEVPTLVMIIIVVFVVVRPF